MKTLLPLASLVFLLSSAAAREWTNVAGKKIEADLVEVKGTPGAEVVVLQMAGGFSAHWCAPCRDFTPKLVNFYNAQPGKKKQFEIIFVSNDSDEKMMEEYIKGDAMPWPAIAYRSVERLKEIKAYAGRGIPCLVLVDREGKVPSHSYQGETYVGPTKVMNDIPKMTAAK